VSCEPRTFLDYLLGNTVSKDGAVRLTEQGRFASADWAHVGAVALLDYIPDGVQQTYMCTTLLNPWCKRDVAVEWDRFSRAYVLRLEYDLFRWHPVEPARAFDFPDGTYVPEGLR
jgi:hypothetical protein